MLVGSVDVIFADVAQPDQARIVAFNAEYFLKNGGHVVISIKASCIDSTAQPEAVFAEEVNKLKKMVCFASLVYAACADLYSPSGPGSSSLSSPTSVTTPCLLHSTSGYVAKRGCQQCD